MRRHSILVIFMTPTGIRGSTRNIDIVYKAAAIQRCSHNHIIRRIRTIITSGRCTGKIHVNFGARKACNIDSIECQCTI